MANERRWVRIGVAVEEDGTRAVALDHETLELIAAHHARNDTISPPTGRLRAEEIRLALGALLSKGDVPPERVLSLSFGTTLGVEAALHARPMLIGVVDVDPPAEGPRGEEDTAPLLSGCSARLARTIVRAHDLEEQGLDALYALRARDVMGIVLNPWGERLHAPGLDALLEWRSRLGVPMCSVAEFSAHADPMLRFQAAIGLVAALDEVFTAGELLGEGARREGLRAPLFVMRNDGGLTAWKALLRRPTLGILSGPAAVMLGALHQGKVRDGIIAHMGRSSTHIAMVRDGRLLEGEAELAHTPVPLRALELLSLPVGSESVVSFRRGTIAGVGPWSAPWLGIAPAHKAPPQVLQGAQLIAFAPSPEHAEEVVLLLARDGHRYALTVADAALCLGLWDAEDERRATARKALEPLAARLALAPEDAAELVLERATQTLARAIQKIQHRHPQFPPPPLLALGASAPLFLPLLSPRLGLASLVLEHGEVMGAFGAALADLRETIERPLARQDEIERLRRDAEHVLLDYGAERASLATHVQWEATASWVTLTVTGRVSPYPERLSPRVTPDQRMALAARLMALPEDRVEVMAETEGFEIYRGRPTPRRFFTRRRKTTICICAKEGDVALALEEATILTTTAAEGTLALERLFEREHAPLGSMRRYVVAATHLLDLSHAASAEQARRWVERILRGLSPTEPVFFLEGHRRS